jgi:superfamily I DNA and/or RNA helicase
MISKLLYKIFPNDKQYIDNAIDTVEKFQGSQRKFIIVSFGVGDPDIIRQEEEFLLNLNRTNVAISRAEEKILIIISEKLVHHLPDDKEVIKTSKAIKSFVYQYCSNKKIYTVKYDSDEKIINYRYK